MLIHRTTSYLQRIAIVEHHQAGWSYHQIATEMRLNYYTIRKWCRTFRDGGWDALRLIHHQKGILSQFHPRVRYVALRLKRQHPGWGLDKIRLELRRRPSLAGLRLPSRSALYLYYQQFRPRLQRHRLLPVKRPVVESNVSDVHECWQMDFKGDEDLGEVGKVKVFNVVDAYSSAPLASRIHPAQRGVIKMRDVQHNLRLTFQEWGLPRSLRMDRDPLFVGSTRLEFPGHLMLWLVGLGVTPIVNRAHRPTDNAQVERCNGIWFEQVGRGQTYRTLDEVQQASDRARDDRLAHLPSRNRYCHQQAPLVTLPHLAQPNRRYTISQEDQLFDIQLIYQYLSQWQWQRIVDSSGQIGFGGSKQRVGYAFSGLLVKLHFALNSECFIVSHLQGHELYRFVLSSITPEVICGTGMIE